MMEIKKFDIVKCPFDEIGLVRKINDKILWGHRYNVEIIKTKGVFNQLGDKVPYKESDLKVVKELHF